MYTHVHTYIYIICSLRFTRGYFDSPRCCHLYSVTRLVCLLCLPPLLAPDVPPSLHTPSTVPQQQQQKNNNNWQRCQCRLHSKSRSVYVYLYLYICIRIYIYISGCRSISICKLSSCKASEATQNCFINASLFTKN